MRDSPPAVSGGNGAAAAVPAWKRYGNGVIANEVSTLTKYYDRAIRWAASLEPVLLMEREGLSRLRYSPAAGGGTR